MKLCLVPAILVLFLAAGCATTEKRMATPEDPFAMPIEEFLIEADLLRTSLAQGEPYEIQAADLQRFDDINEQIRAIVGSATEIEQINMVDRHELFRLRTQMVRLAVGDAEPGKVCFRQHTTGTRLKGSRRCYTLEELAHSRFQAREIMEYIQNNPRGEHPDAQDPIPLIF